MTMLGETARNEGRLHQIVFRWSEQSLSGHRGLGPVASSLDPEQVTQWEHRLQDMIWAAPAEDAAVAYLEFGDEAAVIRRVPASDTTGRESTLAHVIVGPGLDPALALALSRSGWPGWIGVGHEPMDSSLPPLWIDDLRAAAVSGAEGPDGLRAGAAALAGPVLADVVTAAFTDPRAELTVIAPGRDPAAVMFAILELLGDVIPGPFTFSTFEATDTGAGRPRVVFLADRPQFSLRTSARRRVPLPEPGAPPPPASDASDAFDAPDELAVFALAWCRVHRGRGSTGLRPLLPDRPLTTPKEVRSWLRSEAVVNGVLADPVDLLRRAGEDDVTAQEARLLDDGLTGLDLDEALTRLPDAALRELSLAWHVQSPPYERWPALGRRVHDALLLVVLAVWKKDDAIALIEAVRDRETVATRLVTGPEPGGGERRGRRLLRVRRRTGPQPRLAPAPAPQCLPAVVVACRAIGLDERQLHEVLASVLRAVAPTDLVRWIEDHASSSPSAVGTVIHALPVPLASRGKRDIAGYDAFAAAGALTTAVAAVAVADEMPYPPADVLRRLLVQFADGGLDDVGRLEQLLGNASQALRPALIGALWALVTDRRAHRRLGRLVIREYFASHDIVLPVEPERRPRRPVRGGARPEVRDWFALGLVGVGISTIVAAVALLIVLVSV
jgi:hypothetical protein